MQNEKGEMQNAAHGGPMSFDVPANDDNPIQFFFIFHFSFFIPTYP
jgi:hypothetical protein